MNTVIELINLSKHYGSAIGIEHINLSINKGEIFGFLGQNGAGKTTTIRCILNILLPTEGEIKINGTLVSRANPDIRENIGYLPGELQIPKNYRAREFMEYIATLRKRPSSRMDEMIEMFDIPEKKKFSQLSKGNKQKVGIALAFMHDPDILILDEPTSGLDPIYQQKLYDLLEAEKARGKTIFFSSHNLDETQRICDRVAIIREGRLVSLENVKGLAEEVPRELIALVEHIPEDKIEELGDMLKTYNIDTGEIILRISGDTSLSKILVLLADMEIKDLSFPPASLESYFLAKYVEEVVNGV
ncbi:MAG: ABC transporter ATP-binding protein [Candidatus Heimdallarchaeota archaeon]|nr:ABC transporter ATP-binding protein [Candidatus Heimdallarchaeota archaeon]